MTSRTDTLRVQVATLEFVLAAIDAGRNPEAYVGGALRVAREELATAEESEAAFAAKWDGDVIDRALSVRAAYAFGDWPPHEEWSKR